MIKDINSYDKKYLQVIASYLLERIKTDDLLLEKLNNTDKTLNGCLIYVKDEAKKQAEENVAVLCDNEVFQLVVHYFLEDSINKEPKPVKEIESPKPKVVTEETLFGTETYEVSKKEVKEKTRKEKESKVEEDFGTQLSIFD